MSGEGIEKRLQIARLHWELGEHGDALECLERAVDECLPSPELRARLASFLAELAVHETSPQIGEQLRQVLEQLDPPENAREEPEPVSSIATPTLARLLAEQGHADKALAVAARLLEQNPADERALAVKARLAGESGSNEKVIDELSRWLGNARRRRQGRAEA